MKQTILVVEDQVDEQDAMATLLRRHHYIVELAANGQEAIDRLGPGAPLPDLVLLDLNMPVMDGWEFLYQVAQDRSLRRVPVVVIAGTSVQVDAMVVPPKLVFVVKPVRSEELLAQIAELLRPTSLGRAPITSETAAAAGSDDGERAARLDPAPAADDGGTVYWTPSTK